MFGFLLLKICFFCQSNLQDSANKFKKGNRKIFSSPTGEENLGVGPQEIILFSLLGHGTHLTTTLTSQPLNFTLHFPPFISDQ